MGEAVTVFNFSAQLCRLRRLAKTANLNETLLILDTISIIWCG